MWKVLTDDEPLRNPQPHTRRVRKCLPPHDAAYTRGFWFTSTCPRRRRHPAGVGGGRRGRRRDAAAAAPLSSSSLAAFKPAFSVAQRQCDPSFLQPPLLECPQGRSAARINLYAAVSASGIHLYVAASGSDATFHRVSPRCVTYSGQCFENDKPAVIVAATLQTCCAPSKAAKNEELAWRSRIRIADTPFCDNLVTLVIDIQAPPLTMFSGSVLSARDGVAVGVSSAPCPTG